MGKLILSGFETVGGFDGFGKFLFRRAGKRGINGPGRVLIALFRMFLWVLEGRLDGVPGRTNAQASAN